jgi:YjbR
MEPGEVYDELVDVFRTRPGVTVGKALQNEVLKVSDKIFAFLKDDRLVVKVPAADVTALVAGGEAIPFTSGGRRMREWAMLAYSGRDDWESWMAEAYDYVSGLARQ